MAYRTESGGHAYERTGQGLKEARTDYAREHVNPYFLNNPDIFSIYNLTNGKDLSDLRLTVDYPEDLEVARTIYENLYHEEVVPLQDILVFLAENKDLSEKCTLCTKNNCEQAKAGLSK